MLPNFIFPCLFLVVSSQPDFWKTICVAVGIDECHGEYIHQFYSKYLLPYETGLRLYKKKQQEKKLQEEKEAAEKAAAAGGTTVTAPSSSSSSSSSGSSLSANLMGPDPMASANHHYSMSNNPTPSNQMGPGNIPPSFNDEFSRQWQQVPLFSHLYYALFILLLILCLL